MSNSEERENEERDSSRSEDNSFDWLEQLAGEPDAIWDQAPSSIEGSVVDSPVAASNDSGAVRAEGNHDPAPKGDMGQDHDKPALESKIEPVDITLSEQQLGPVRDHHLDVVLEAAIPPESDTRYDASIEKPDPEAVDGRRNDSMASDQLPGSDAMEAFGWDGDRQETVDLGIEIDLENDDLMWLDEMDTVSDMNVNSQENDEKQPVESLDGSANHQMETHSEGEAVSMEPATVDSEQVPEDPDEAIAWLERLAAKQGAPAEELPTVKSTVSFAVEEMAAVDPELNSSYEESGEIPEDPDEAMAWLERLAARQGTDEEELTTFETISDVAEPGPASEFEDEVIVEGLQPSVSGDLDEALGWLEELTVPQETIEEVATETPPITVPEELPTPAIAHDVEEALAGAELLFAEPESAPSTEMGGEPIDESQIEDPDDAMAWLEQLAARQGAPIEELTTIDGDAEGQQISAEPDAGLIAQEADQLDGQESLAVVAPVDDSPAPPVAAVPVIDELFAEPAEDVEVAAADETVDIVEEYEIAAAAEVDEAVEIDSTDAADEESAVKEVAPDEDLAWLDTLGSVDAESWLAGEAAEDQFEAVKVPSEGPELELFEVSEAAATQPKPVPGILPDAPGSEELTLARQAMKEGAVESGLATYSTLVEKGEFLPFLIDDLEIASQEQGPEPRLQRVLGDAYARNGQLQKALQAYREALDNL